MSEQFEGRKVCVNGECSEKDVPKPLLMHVETHKERYTDNGGDLPFECTSTDHVIPDEPAVCDACHAPAAIQQSAPPRYQKAA